MANAVRDAAAHVRGEPAGADPVLAGLARLPVANPSESVHPQRDDPQIAQLRRLLALARRLHTEPSVERILDNALDTAIELTCAERGFVLLRQPDGELAVAVSRNFFAGEQDAGPGPGRVGPSISYAIAERVARTGSPVVSIDMESTDRSTTGSSTTAVAAVAAVASLPPRSVLAVPLRQRGAITGCLYVDHRLHGGAFDAAAASVLGELADIAAIAIENARVTGDLRQTTRELDARNHQLARELDARDAEPIRVTARPEPAGPAAGDDLRLRPALDGLEQAYLAAAMARAQGNQTAAARLLGLSRFGLQKKLRRRASDDGDGAS